jgi:hypothetical protein
MEEYQLPHDEPVDRERPLFLSITMSPITSSYSSTISEVSENASLGVAPESRSHAYFPAIL